MQQTNKFSTFISDDIFEIFRDIDDVQTEDPSDFIDPSSPDKEETNCERFSEEQLKEHPELKNARNLQDIFNLRLNARIHQNMRRLRKEHGFTQEELAKKTNGYSPGVARHESLPPKTRVTSIDYCRKLANAYKMSLYEVVEQLLKPIEDNSLFQSEADNSNDYASEGDAPEYPANLVFSVLCEGHFSKEDSLDIYKIDYAAVYGAIHTLTEREQQVIEYRFRDGLTLEEIGEKFNVTSERIRQTEAKAIRKLRHPSRSKKFLLLSIDEVESEIKNLKEELLAMSHENTVITKRLQRWETLASKHSTITLSKVLNEVYDEEFPTGLSKTHNLLNIPISDLGLSVRSYNALSRHGIKTIEDLAQTNAEYLTKVRNLGLKSRDEIIEKMKEQYGIDLKIT